MSSSRKNNQPKLLSVADASELSLDDIHELYRRHINSSKVDLLTSFQFGNDKVVKAAGCYIWTLGGRKIVDFTGGIGVLNHGHNHPRILKARARFAQNQSMEVHKNFFSPWLAALSHNVATLLPNGLDYCFFPNSGSEAVEWAIKTAFKFHGSRRQRIIHSDLSFHGKLLASDSITASPENNYDYPGLPDVETFNFNSVASLRTVVERSIDDNGNSSIAAMVLEAFNVSNLLSSTERFLEEARSLCDQYSIVLILDEVYSGWGKTGYLFNFMQHTNFKPDILCTAKSLGGGKASIAGVIIDKKIFGGSYDTPAAANLQSSTFNGFGEETVTALEAVNVIIEEGLVEKAKQIGRILEPGLETICNKIDFVSEIRGSGALYGVFFKSKLNNLDVIADQIPIELFRDQRFTEKLTLASIVDDLYVNYGWLTFFSFGKDLHLIVSPPLVTPLNEVERFLVDLENCLSKGLTSLVANFVRKKFAKILTNAFKRR